MGLVDQMVVLCLVFSETSILFSIVVVLIYILTNSVGGFPGLAVLMVKMFSFSLREAASG